MPELRKGVKFMLFISSYIPLFVIMAGIVHPIQTSIYGFSIPWLSILFLILCLVPLPLLYVVIEVRKYSTTDYKQVTEYRKRNDMVTSYLLVYVFTFLGLDYSDPVSWFAFGVFFTVVAIIQLRSKQLHVNPLLSLAGYDLYEVKLDREVTLVITKAEMANLLKPPDDDEGDADYSSNERYIEMAELGNNVYIAKW